MKKSFLRRNLLAAIAILSVTSPARATVRLAETFFYPDGRLASAPPEGGVSGGLWTVLFSGPYPVMVTNGTARLFHFTQPHGPAPPGETVTRGFSPLAAGQTIYAGLDVSTTGNSAGLYFANFAFAQPQ